MTRPATRPLAVVLLFGGLLAGCGSSSTPDEPAVATTSPSTASSVRAELCGAYGSLKTKVGDLDSAPLDSSASAEQFQQQVQEMQAKTNKLQDDLATMQTQSNGGPADAVISAFDQKAESLSASLNEAKDGAQEQVGPKITAAQQELKTVYSSVTTKMDKLCPSSGATPEATTEEP